MHLPLIDYICIVGYLGCVITLGSWFSREQKTTRSYFLAGKSIGWLPLSISMYATLFSSLTFVMAPAEAFRGDLQYFVALAMFPIASIASIVLFIDFYTRLPITTIYEYVEVRFNRALGDIVMAMFILYRCLYAAIVVFALSMVLHVTMGLPLEPTMVGVGIGAIVYTTLGGMKAVIWTDVAQFFILFVGLLLALGFAISRLPGGFGEMYTVAAAAGKLRVANLDIDLNARYVFWTLVPYGLVEFMGSKTVDQMNVQRYLSARNPRNAKLAMLVQSCFTMPVWLLLFAVGMALYAYYTRHPSVEIAGFVEAKQYDRIFPHFIFSVMPPGVRGLLIAALLAAAMSTMDSVLNVLSTISIVNVYKGRMNPTATDARCLRMAKVATVGWGLVVIALAFAMTGTESILKTINSIAGMCIGPMVGVFVLGMWFRRTRWVHALMGMVASFAIVLFMKYCTDITFTLYGIAGVSATIATGWILSLLIPMPMKELAEVYEWKWRGFQEALLGGAATGESEQDAAPPTAKEE